MKTTCADLQTESEKCGDEHYNKMSKWVTHHVGADTSDACFVTALAYEAALNAFLEGLQMETRSERTRRQIDFTLKYRSLLYGDLKILLSHGAMV